MIRKRFHAVMHHAIAALDRLSASELGFTQPAAQEHGAWGVLMPYAPTAPPGSGSTLFWHIVDPLTSVTPFPLLWCLLTF